MTEQDRKRIKIVAYMLTGLMVLSLVWFIVWGLL